MSFGVSDTAAKDVVADRLGYAQLAQGKGFVPLSERLNHCIRQVV